MNSVSIIGTLLHRDEAHPELRYLLVEREYATEKNDSEDVIALLSWNREPKGELFSFKEGSFVAVKGRLETYFDKTVIISESIQYLGRK